ncbi:amino acid permease, partial [Streptomyces sp. AC563]
PGVFQRISPKTATPVAGTWIVAAVFAVPAAVVPLKVVLDLTTIGTLSAMVIVNVSVIVLRRSRPGLARPFRTPLFPLPPLLGIACCGYLIYGTGTATWLQFGVFLLVGAVLYMAYGRRHSRLRGARAGAAGTEADGGATAGEAAEAAGTTEPAGERAPAATRGR